ncbi:MAG: DNA-3-methyladenine glycosylase 2 family protein [Gammaproteobacteria bacterium]|nr:DNA-3-methyladenine glycosylase 2 family protein [Gammaproteobacteria bacterium]
MVHPIVQDHNLYPQFWQVAKNYLMERDSLMSEIIPKYGDLELRSRGDAYQTLVRSIVGQQISTKAADSVWLKLNLLCQPMNPSVVWATSVEDLRKAGLSARKVEYILDLSDKFLQNQIQPENWHFMTDEELVDHLTKVRGIGRWTVEMLLIFHLLRPDVLPLGDLGLIKGIKKLYSLPDTSGKGEILAITNRWTPYRSVGTWYVWRFLDPVPIEY